MVLLTMTASIVEAIEILDQKTVADVSEETMSPDPDSEPPLRNAAIGNPISHGQILDIWRQLKGGEGTDVTLEKLLRGATVYIPPPPPKPEPTKEYKALMARLRHEEEERSYERMIQKYPARESFAQRFPSAPIAHAFAEVNKPSKASDMGDDFAIEYGDVQKQVTVIFNFLVSIIGCGAALWLAARWWSTPARLFLSLGGSIVVAIAEVAVYSAYTWRMAEGEKKEKKKKEVKEVVNTWVVNQGEGDEKTLFEAPSPSPNPIELEADANSNLRRRIKDLVD
ncbi:hypothetical protein SLS62_003678 [Diatrype stigma]|uniref:Uncharacterized protein n=1 Tax=Diatrype stigma TaxID=117547 RepID=A0AAN9YUH0_9PEZI